MPHSTTNTCVTYVPQTTQTWLQHVEYWMRSLPRNGRWAHGLLQTTTGRQTTLPQTHIVRHMVHSCHQRDTHAHLRLCYRTTNCPGLRQIQPLCTHLLRWCTIEAGISWKDRIHQCHQLLRCEGTGPYPGSSRHFGSQGSGTAALLELISPAGVVVGK